MRQYRDTYQNFDAQLAMISIPQLIEEIQISNFMLIKIFNL